MEIKLFGERKNVDCQAHDHDSDNCDAPVHDRSQFVLGKLQSTEARSQAKLRRADVWDSRNT